MKHFLLRRRFAPFIFDAIGKGFQGFSVRIMLSAKIVCSVFRDSFLMLWARVFSDFTRIVCYLHLFARFYAMKLHVVAIRKGFKVIVMLLL